MHLFMHVNSTSMTQTSGQGRDRFSIETTAKRVLGPLSWLIHLFKMLPYTGYQTALRFERDMRAMSRGVDLLEWWSKELHLNLQVEGIENVPVKGPVVLYANHPTGLCDGLSVWDAVKHKRPDFKIIMNAHGLDAFPAFKDLLVPVRLNKDGSSRDAYTMWSRLNGVLSQENLALMFPAGRLSQLDWFGDWDVHERPWRKGIQKIARDFPDAALVPVLIEGRVRKHFYILHRLFPALRDLLLYTEFHGKQNWSYAVRFLPPIEITSAATAQAYVEGHRRKKWFQLKRP